MSSSVTMRASLSTWVRAVNQITPYLGCDETRSSTATAARPLSRPWSQLSYCGWKTENVLSPLASCRGHGSISTSEAAGDSPKADMPDVHPARPGNTSSMRKSAYSGLRFHRSQRFVIYFLLGPLRVSAAHALANLHSRLFGEGWRTRRRAAGEVFAGMRTSGRPAP